MLTVALDNVRLDSVPNIHNSTYKIFLAYNGTLGAPISIHYSGKKKSKGLSIRQISINFRLILGWFLSSSREMLDEVVIDIKMFNSC
jgi:hypothetical protein